MITLLVYNIFHQYFLKSLVNDQFSSLKLNVFVTTIFICSNKYVKYVKQVLASIYPNFLEKVLSKIQISEIYRFLLGQDFPSCLIPFFSCLQTTYFKKRFL